MGIFRRAKTRNDMCVLTKEVNLQLDCLHWAVQYLVLLQHLSQALQLPVHR